MKVKVTVEVGSDIGGMPVSMVEVDKVLIGALGGIMEKYRGRISNINDSYGEIIYVIYGQTVKTKMIMIVDEEKKVEG